MEVIYGYPGESNIQAALRKYQGRRNTFALEAEKDFRDGQTLLKDAGIGKTISGRQAITETDKPRMVGLFKALHGEGPVP